MEGWNILNIVVVICVLVWLLFAFGILNHKWGLSRSAGPVEFRRLVVATGSDGQET
jgi:hypothetical protein